MKGTETALEEAQKLFDEGKDEEADKVLETALNGVLSKIERVKIMLYLKNIAVKNSNNSGIKKIEVKMGKRREKEEKEREEIKKKMEALEKALKDFDFKKAKEILNFLWRKVFKLTPEQISALSGFSREIREKKLGNEVR